MYYKKKALLSILEEYLRKFPEKERENLIVELNNETIFIKINGDIHSLRMVNVVVNVLLKHINFGDIDKYFIFDISLSIEEAMLNIYLHSYPAGKGTIELELVISEDNIQVSISDFGEYGANLNLEERLSAPPTQMFSSTGRGFLLIKKAVDHIEYSTQNGKNTLMIIKKYRG